MLIKVYGFFLSFKMCGFCQSFRRSWSPLWNGKNRLRGCVCVCVCDFSHFDFPYVIAGTLSYSYHIYIYMHINTYTQTQRNIFNTREKKKKRYPAIEIDIPTAQYICIYTYVLQWVPLMLFLSFSLSLCFSFFVCAREMGVYTENSFMTEKANSVNVLHDSVREREWNGNSNSNSNSKSTQQQQHQ